MRSSHRPSFFQVLRWLQWIFCGLTLIGAFLMVVPAFTAASAGLASVSVVVFGVAAVCIGLSLFSPTSANRLLLWITFIIAIACATVPSLLLARVASDNGVHLAFHPKQYLTFLGDTKIASESVQYKQSPQGPLYLALYRPEAKSSGHTIFMLHGGGWRYGNHTQLGLWPELLTRQGHTVIGLQYRLASDDYHTWRDAPEDVADAITYVKKSGDSLRVPTKKISLLGQSAGGQLALLEAYRSRSVESVIALYAPTDLTLDYRTSRDKTAEQDFVGGTPSQYPDRYAALSPVTHVTASSPRTLLVQGTTDDLVSPRNAEQLDKRLSANGVYVDTVILPLVGHSFDNQRGGLATQIASQKVLEFLNE